MAGPVNHLITRKLSVADIEKLRVYLSEVTRINEYQENYLGCSQYWDVDLSDGVVSRPRLQKKLSIAQWYPLLISITDLAVEAIDEYRSTILELDLELGSQISVSSMVKSLPSRRSMAQLEVNLIKMFGGYIDLLSLLYPPVNANYSKSDIDREEEITAYTANVPGRIYKKYYEVESHGTKHFSQIVDREFMENWLVDKRFHLPK
jgi:Family of unknown function (DUF6368)